MPRLIPYWQASLVVGVPLGAYLTFLGLCATTFFQRHFLYAHKVHNLWWPWTDVNQPERWGFAKNQVTPFTIGTADGQALYAWHILPLPLYAQHESSLARQPGGFRDDVRETFNFKLLREDPNARLVVYFHGNAGHIAQGIRTMSYHTLTDTSSYHVLAIDYRGFGHSTGHPTEAGLIADGIAAVEWALQTAGLPASRLVLLGQSLGTAVTAGVAEHFARDGVDFAGVILVSAFSSLPAMLSHYAIAGYVPVLLPLRGWPWLLKLVLSRLADPWPSAERLRSAVQAVKARGGRLRLGLIHARDDWDIPCREDDALFAAAVNGTLGESGDVLSPAVLAVEKEARTIHKGKDAFVATWKDGDVVIRQELFPHGGHNDIMMYAPVTLAVLDSLDLVGTVYSGSQ